MPLKHRREDLIIELNFAPSKIEKEIFLNILLTFHVCYAQDV